MKSYFTVPVRSLPRFALWTAATLCLCFGLFWPTPDSSASSQVDTQFASSAPRLTTKSMEQIAVGDLVWATDPETGVAGPRRVVEVYHNRTDTLLHLTLRDRERAEYTYSTTKEHPFWTENRGWVSAGELTTGDIVRQLDGQQGEFVASRVEPLGRIIPVYNFQVEGLHTYFVLPVTGETTVAQDLVTNAFLVHNECGEQKRDSKGRFLPKDGGEARPGSIAEDDVWNSIENDKSKKGWTVTRGQVTTTDSTGQKRVYDGYATTPGPSPKNIGLEIKSGDATKTRQQREFDDRLNSDRNNKATGVGKKHKGVVIDRALEIRR